MIYELWILSGVVAFLLNKNKEIDLPDFKNPLLLITPLLLQLAAMALHNYIPERQIIFASLLNASYILLLIALWNNRHVPGIPLFVIGVSANALVIWLNEGRMPVSVDALYFLGLENHIPRLEDGVSKHTVMDGNTSLFLLGDLIPVKRPYGGSQVISIGDVFQSLGIAFLIWKIFRGFKIRV